MSKIQGQQGISDPRGTYNLSLCSYKTKESAGISSDVHAEANVKVNETMVGTSAV